MPDSPATVITEVQPPSFLQAALCFVAILLTIAFGLFVFQISLHSLMFLCLCWVWLNGRILGYSNTQLRELMSLAITRAIPAIYIFILIGAVVASFMQSGTIGTLMYYGLSWLSPAWFLSLGMILCALMSLATGTSWGTVGTLGVVFIGIGDAMGIPLPMVAGMIVCGATFGDKMSPISDTTNLAAMSADTNLYRHIYSMLFTTGPTLLLSLLIFTVIGFQYQGQEVELTAIAEIRAALVDLYRLTPAITLLPLAVLAILSFRRVPAEVAMSISVLCALIIAITYQGTPTVEALNAIWLNTPTNSGIENLDALLGRGGISSMSWTLLLALMALSLGGILHGCGFLTVILSGIINRVRHTASLVAATIFTGVMGNLAMGEAYISIILSCQLFKTKFEQLGIDKAVLSRSVEEGATLSTALIPWTTAGAFYSATLGVSVVDYAPYAFFNYLNGLIAISMAMLGIGLLRKAERNVSAADSLT